MGVCEGQLYMQDIYTEYINTLGMRSAHTCYLRLLLGILCQLYLKHICFYTHTILCKYAFLKNSGRIMRQGMR